VAEGPSRPGRLLHLLILLGPVAALLLANLAIAGLMQVLLPLDLDAPAWILTVIVVGQSAAVCALVVLFCALLLRVQGLRLRDAGLCWTRTSWASLLAGLGVGMAVVLAIGLPLTWSGLLRTSPDFGLPWWGLVIAGLAQAFLLQGLPEELLFRGYQMTALRRRPIVALFISAAVFGVIHLASSGGQQNVLERMLYLVMPFGFAVAGRCLDDSPRLAVGGSRRTRRGARGIPRRSVRRTGQRPGVLGRLRTGVDHARARPPGRRQAPGQARRALDRSDPLSW